MIEKLANKKTFLQTKDSLVTAEKSIVLREKRLGGDLSEDLTIDKNSKTEGDIDHSLQIARIAQGLDRQGEVFTTQGQEKVLKEVYPRPQDTSEIQPIVSLEAIYKNIQEKVEKLCKKVEQ